MWCHCLQCNLWYKTVAPYQKYLIASLKLIWCRTSFSGDFKQDKLVLSFCSNTLRLLSPLFLFQEHWGHIWAPITWTTFRGVRSRMWPHSLSSECSHVYWSTSKRHPTCLASLANVNSSCLWTQSLLFDWHQRQTSNCHIHKLKISYS